MTREKSVGVRRRWTVGSTAAATSGREARATLATASAENRAAGTGTHTESEAVRASPTTVIGLERALHLLLLQV